MIYISPLDLLSEEINSWGGYSAKMECNSRMDTIFKELKKSNRLENRIFHPQRIVRGLIDLKIERGKSLDYEQQSKYLELISDAMNFCQEVYLTKDYINVLDQLREKLESLSDEPLFRGILNRYVKEEEDLTTWAVGTEPLRSKNTARALSEYPKILMIPLAHGSLRAATDIFLRYRQHNQRNPKNFSTIYPVRFSTDKSCDKYPRILTAEEDYLKEKAEDRKVIIFDEDVHSGGTMIQAISFFEHFFGKEILAATNFIKENSGLIDRNLLEEIVKKHRPKQERKK